jgi:acyl-CoA thioester hydrolase
MSQRHLLTRFPRLPDAPSPLLASVERRVTFSDVDPMGIVWFGRYPLFIEMAAEELWSRCGLSYVRLYEVGVCAPVAKLNLDYLRPMRLGETIQVTAAWVWDEAAKLNTEYVLTKPDGLTAAVASCVQVFADLKSGAPLLLFPPLIQRVREEWSAGAFSCHQQTPNA